MTQTRQTRSDAAVPAAAVVDEAAVELARTLDLYTADGQPDVVRATKLQKLISDTSRANAEEQVRPLHESTTRERSSFMYQRALVTKAPDGRSCDPEVLEAIWTRADPKVSSTEEGAAGLVAMALGLSVMRGPRTATPPAVAPLTAPLHTEPAGSRTTNRAPMSALDTSIAKLRGLDHKTYGERSQGFNPGRTNQLED
jgi:hypothetical protein